MYENISIQNLSAAQRKKVPKDKIHELLETQLGQQNLPIGETLKTLISEAVKEAVGTLYDDVQGLKVEMEEVKDELKNIKTERDTLKKVVSEQQKFLESVRRDKVKDNIFMSGIPNSMNIEGANTEDNTKIVQHILSYIAPTTAANDYKVIKVFEPRDGLPRHSCLLGFTNTVARKSILDNSKELNKLGEDNVLKKVYVKSEQTPLTRKENSRLYGEFKKLQETHKDDENMKVVLQKGKLYLNDEVVDEYSLSNQLF